LRALKISSVNKFFRYLDSTREDEAHAQIPKTNEAEGMLAEIENVFNRKVNVKRGIRVIA
jgi:hypothetical protein